MHTLALQLTVDRGSFLVKNLEVLGRFSIGPWKQRKFPGRLSRDPQQVLSWFFSITFLTTMWKLRSNKFVSFFMPFASRMNLFSGQTSVQDNPVNKTILHAGLSYAQGNPVCRIILCAGNSCVWENPVYKIILCWGTSCLQEDRVRVQEIL